MAVNIRGLGVFHDSTVVAPLKPRWRGSAPGFEVGRTTVTQGMGLPRLNSRGPIEAAMEGIRAWLVVRSSTTQQSWPH